MCGRKASMAMACQRPVIADCRGRVVLSRQLPSRHLNSNVVRVSILDEIEKSLAMNTTVITTTNPATGTITTTTIIHHFHYWLFILAILAVALICSGLRALFWNKDSN
jgi:hypothetical protein